MINPMLAVIGLSGGELVLLLGAALLCFAVLIGGAVAIVWLFRRKNRVAPAPAPPPVPPKSAFSTTLAMKECPQCHQLCAPDAPEGLCPQCLAKAAFGTEPTSPKPQTPPETAELAAQFPQLEILGLLGKGGMGMVYKARQPRLDRIVALKILPIDSAPGASFAERFEREAKALAKLNHPGIVTLHDFGQTSRYYYFIMEYVDGMNLRQLLQSHALEPRQALDLVTQICTALQFAHDENIVHRDIKPENILINKKGQVKIADFGLAKLLGTAPHAELTMSQAAMGTLNYMAPEQRENAQTVDHRADIYSLGVVFYEMLTGEVPMGRFEPPSTRAQVDVRLDEVVLRALEREPARRYQHVSEVKSRVQTIESTATDEKPAPSGSTPVAAKADHFWRRLVVIVLLLIGIPVFLAVLGMLAAIAIPSFVIGREHAQQLAGRQLNQEGWQLLQEGKFDDARKKFAQIQQLDPANVEGWNGLGWTWLNAGQPRTAETNFRKALSLDATHPGALNGLGQVYLSQRNYQEAEKYLLQAAPKAPAAWYGLARLYLLEGKFDSAAEWAQKVVDSGQADESARQMLKAAQEKHLGDGLRRTIEPPPRGDNDTPPAKVR